MFGALEADRVLAVLITAINHGGSVTINKRNRGCGEVCVGSVCCINRAAVVSSEENLFVLLFTCETCLLC